MSDTGDSSSENSAIDETLTANKKGEKQKEKARVSKTSAILWHSHQNDAAAVRKLLEEDPSLVNARDYDNRTPLHVASLHGWINVAKCLIEFGADVNAQDRWRNTQNITLSLSEDGQLLHLDDRYLLDFCHMAWKALYGVHGNANIYFSWKKEKIGQADQFQYLVFLVSSRAGVSSLNARENECLSCSSYFDMFMCPSQSFITGYTTIIYVRECHRRDLPASDIKLGQNGSHFEPRAVPPPLPNKCDWEIEPSELDFSNSSIIGKGSFGEILKAYWRGTPVAVKRILPSLTDDKLVTQDFRHEVNLLVKLRHPNIVQFLGAVTEKKPLMLITEYLRGGDLHQYLKEKGALSPATAINFAMDIARTNSIMCLLLRGMAYLHNEPNVIIHRDLKPRNVLLVNSSADHLKVGDFGLSKLIRVQHAHDVYKMTGETGSYRYMAPEVFRHRKYDKKVDVFSFAMILYEMLEGDPPMSSYEPYEAAKYVADGHRPNIRSKGCIPELKELIEQCWAADMTHRPSFLEILKRLEKTKEHLPGDHPWHFFS
ncbi:hypothetical protein KSS87_017699 [Heliosperma pusillum]|nr:hypothetical protein KSS87_017699 [Heliosperma pusillum]